MVLGSVIKIEQFNGKHCIHKEDNMKRLQKTIGLVSVLMALGLGNVALAADAPVVIKSGNVEYRTQVQNEGWQTWMGEDEQSGTSGKGLRLEAIEIKVTGLPDKTDQVGITYRTHVQNIGWQDRVVDGQTSGTVGLGLRLEAIQIALTGEDADKYDVYYQVHAQNIGTMGWAKNGEAAGTAGYGYRLEAIRIQLKQKSEAAPVNYGSQTNPFKEYVPGSESGSTGNTGNGNYVWDITGGADYGTGISN